MNDFETVIVGAGVIGLAVARELAQRGQNVLILEKERSFGMGISSRNSEVIHAGVYYRTGSLKAKHCVQGRKLLYTYCEQKGVNYRRIGKLIVATNHAEMKVLNDIQSCSDENGLVGSDRLEMLSKNKVSEIEPELSCVAALYSPSTGVIDSHAYMQNLAWDAESLGATLAYNTEVKVINYKNEIRVIGESVGEKFEVKARNLILAAGISTAQISTEAHLPTPPSYWLKGNYFSLRQQAPFDHLIYPVPSAGGLGTHLTLDLHGRAKFGPDTQAIDCEDYTVDPARVDDFERSIRRYWPGLPSNSLAPAYAGIRPKIYSLSSDEPDFNIFTPEQTGVEGLYVLHGIESPGLTSSLSLAGEIANQLKLM